ncbi:MAG: glycosyltransferase [Eubacterium sp.]|nr:glycosyltransferase [Eubacterium sp.]
MISVIIPVYNVENYIDHCLESVTNQTYQDIEIIVINDGSTDASLQKCQEWAKKDVRIKLYSKENEGLGPTRNLGIQVAQGEYLFFVDSDDWIAHNTLELMHTKAKNTDADIVLCNRFLVEQDAKGEYICKPYRLPIQIEGVTNAKQQPEIVYHADTATWDKLYRRELIISSGLKQPAHPYEDTPNVPLFMILARKVAQVEECCYYYFNKRPGNITGKADNVHYILDSLRELKENAIRLGLFEEYEKSLMRYSVFMVRSTFYHLKQCVSGSLYDEYVKKILHPMYQFMDENYTGWRVYLNRNYLVWGSYNLRSIVAKMVIDIAQIKQHYSFSSIMCGHNTLKLSLSHPNGYRLAMIQKDISGEFFHLSKENLEDIDYVFVDFLEERFPVFQYDKQYVTASDALIEIQDELPQGGRLLEREQLDDTLWKTYCLEFVETLKNYVRPEQIVLVRTRLCEEHGLGNKNVPFADEKKIQQMNQRIEAYEEFFISRLPGIRIFDFQNFQDYLYTDEYFVHGCESCHMNELLYCKISDEIMRELTQYVILGCGNDGQRIARELGSGQVKCFADNDFKQAGKVIEGHKVRHLPSAIEELKNYPFIVASRRYESQMRKQLQEYGVLKILTPYELRIQRKFEGKQKERRYILLNNPEHQNIGDHLITLAEEQFLKDFIEEDRLIEVTDRELCYGRHMLKSLIRKEDVLLISGGGYLGNLWMEYGETLVRQVIEDYPENKVIVFPQTIYYTEDEAGRDELEKSKKIYGRHKNLTICVREHTSYELLKEQFADSIHLLYCPDMALYGIHLPKRTQYAKDKIAICLRKDSEKLVSRQKVEAVLTQLEVEKSELEMFDTLAGYDINDAMREAEVLARLKQLGEIDLMITDRLHCMLMCVLTGTPCIAFDNRSHKISGVYEAIHDIPWVRMADEKKQIAYPMKCEIYAEYEQNHFGLEEYFERLQQLIRE